MIQHLKPVLSYVEVSKTCGEPCRTIEVSNRKAISPNVLAQVDQVIR